MCHLAGYWSSKVIIEQNFQLLASVVGCLTPVQQQVWAFRKASVRRPFKNRQEAYSLPWQPKLWNSMEAVFAVGFKDRRT